jgi:hypothetical protein
MYRRNKTKRYMATTSAHYDSNNADPYNISAKFKKPDFRLRLTDVYQRCVESVLSIRAHILHEGADTLP